MDPEMEKPRVTEIQVRIDCNGCVQKIKKALHGIQGIGDIYINIPQQKLTITGSADPEKIVRAIKKTRKAATICSGTEPEQPTEPQPPPDPSNPPPEEIVPPAEPVEPPKEEDNPLAEDAPEPAPAPGAPTPAQEPQFTDSTARQPPQPYYGSKEAEEVHVVHHYPPDHSYRYGHDRVYTASVEHYSSTPGPLYKHDQQQPWPPQPINVTHSYNTYKPTPYVTEHKYIRPPPQYTHYSRPERPQPYTHYSKQEPPPYSRPQIAQQFARYTKPEPTLQDTHYSRREPPQPYKHYSIDEPPEQYTQYYNRSEPPPPHTRYSRPEPPQQHTHYNRSEPPPLYTHYSRPEPPSQYNIPEPPQPYTNYSRPEPPPPPSYAHYSGEYHSSSSNGNGNITSIFSDENPNACAIV